MKAMSVKKTEENIPKFMDPSVPLRFLFGSPSVMLVFSKKHDSKSVLFSCSKSVLFSWA